MPSDEESNPLDVLKPGDLDALIKPPPEEDAPELSGKLGEVAAPWVGAEESWRATATGDPAQAPAPDSDRPAADSDRPAAEARDDDGPPDSPRLSDIDVTSAAQAAAALPATERGLSPRAKGALIAVAILIGIGIIATLWLLDLREEYLHRQKLAELRDRHDTSARLQLASLLFGDDEDRPTGASGAATGETPRGGDQQPTAERSTDGSGRSGERSARGAEGPDDADEGSAAAAGPAALDENPFPVEPTDEALAPQPSAPDQLSELLEGADRVDADDLRAERQGQPDAEKVIVLEGEQFNKLPEQPSRQQVKTALDAVAGAVKRCGQGAGGKLLIRVQVAGFTGRVTGAQVVSAEHQGTSLATCAARAVRAAKFPKFSKDSISVKYPFEL